MPASADDFHRLRLLVDGFGDGLVGAALGPDQTAIVAEALMIAERVKRPGFIETAIDDMSGYMRTPSGIEVRLHNVFTDPRPA